MKTIRLPAALNLLQVDRHLASKGLRCVRFSFGREASTKDGRLERQHVLIVVDAK